VKKARKFQVYGGKFAKNGHLFWHEHDANFMTETA